jgi:hypothetical protein
MPQSPREAPAPNLARPMGDSSERLPGSLGSVVIDRELPRRADLGTIFDELDYQTATQAYLWALPLVSYAQWQRVHYDVFGAGPCDLVCYVSYRDRQGLSSVLVLCSS